MVKEKINDVIAGARSITEPWTASPRRRTLFSRSGLSNHGPAAGHQRPSGRGLLIDEVDKSDPEFEAFLLEVLSDFQVSIPELGTRRARHIPSVFLTSNDSRDMSDALKRRCLHLYIDYPDRDLELKIVQLKLPSIGERLTLQLVDAIRRIRTMDSRRSRHIGDSGLGAGPGRAPGGGPVAGGAAGNLNVICKHRSDVQQVSEKIPSSFEFVSCFVLRISNMAQLVR